MKRRNKKNNFALLALLGVAAAVLFSARSGEIIDPEPQVPALPDAAPETPTRMPGPVVRLPFEPARRRTLYI